MVREIKEGGAGEVVGRYMENAEFMHDFVHILCRSMKSWDMNDRELM